MTYEVYRYIFMGGAVLSVIMFAVSLFLLFFLKIPKVVNDLTGRTARKAIQNIREQNENSGEKKYKTSAVNAERGKLTDKISPSGNLIKSGDSMNVGTMTEKISTQEIEGANETTVLETSETSLLSPELNIVRGKTDVLKDTDVTSNSAFEIEFEITFVHTAEIIS